MSRPRVGVDLADVGREQQAQLAIVEPIDQRRDAALVIVADGR